MSTSEVIIALFWRALTIDELGVERGITTAKAFRAVRDAMARGWVEQLGPKVSESGPLRLYRLTPEGCIELAPLIEAAREGPSV